MAPKAKSKRKPEKRRLQVTPPKQSKVINKQHEKCEKRGHQEKPPISGTSSVSNVDSLEAALPPDAPLGHEAYEKCFVSKDRDSRPVVMFKYRQDDEICRTFQVGIGRCGSTESAFRVARACYMKLEQRSAPDQVQAFRLECYKKLKPKTNDVEDDHLSTLTRTAGVAAPDTSIDEKTPTKDGDDGEPKKKNKCADVKQVASLKSPPVIQKEMMPKRNCKAEEACTDLEKQEHLQNKIQGLVAERQRKLAAPKGSTEANRSSSSSSDPLSQMEVSQRRPSLTCSPDVSVTKSSRQISKANQSSSCSSDHLSQMEVSQRQPPLTCSPAASMTKSPRQTSKADIDDLMLSFSVPPAPQTHGDLITAAEKTLAALRKNSAPRMGKSGSRKRSFPRSLGMPNIGAQAMQASTEVSTASCGKDVLQYDIDAMQASTEVSTASCGKDVLQYDIDAMQASREVSTASCGKDNGKSFPNRKRICTECRFGRQCLGITCVCHSCFDSDVSLKRHFAQNPGCKPPPPKCSECRLSRSCIGISCVCGACFDSLAARDAHRPKVCRDRNARGVRRNARSEKNEKKAARGELFRERMEKKRAQSAEAMVDTPAQKRPRAMCYSHEASTLEADDSAANSTSCTTSVILVDEVDDVLTNGQPKHSPRKALRLREEVWILPKGRRSVKHKFYLGCVRSFRRARMQKRSKTTLSATSAESAKTNASQSSCHKATLVQPSILREDAASLQSSLKAVKKQLKLRPCPDVAIECFNLAQIFADAVDIWPDLCGSDVEQCSDTLEGQDPSVVIIKLAMLVAIPPLLELAAEHPHGEAELRAKEMLLQRLEGDCTFAAEFVKDNAIGDAVKDIEELEVAKKNGVLFSDKLLEFKLRMERDVHIAKVRESIAFWRGREAMLLAAKNVAMRWVYAELAWRSGGAAKATVPAAHAAVLGQQQFNSLTSTFAPPELIATHFSACKPLDDEDGESQRAPELALQRQCRSFADQLLAELHTCAEQSGDASKDSGSSSASAPSTRSERSRILRAVALTAVTQTLAEMALVQCRRLQTKWESSHLQLLAARKEAKLNVAVVADGNCAQLLQVGEGKLQELRSLLERVTDERVHGEVLRELKLEMKREAEGQLCRAHDGLKAAEAELERCAAAAAAWESLAEVTVSRSQVVALSSSTDETKSSCVPSSCLGSNLSRNDWARLDDGKHLNDALVDIFVGLLASHLGGPRVHAFSSQFFLQLTSRDAEDGVQGWEHVRTWTRGARKLHNHGIFGHDFLILPINVDSVHWMLTIVCYPAIAGSHSSEKTSQDEFPNVINDAGEKRQTPVIAFLDSLGPDNDAQARVLRFLRGYLSSEWKDCVGGSYDSEAIQGLSIDVPRQQNSDDCGVFVLEFVAQLLRHPTGLKSLAAAVPSHCLSVLSEPRHRWRRAADILRVQGDAGVTRALAELCDDFPAPSAAQVQEQETPKSKPKPKQQARSLLPFGTPRR